MTPDDVDRVDVALSRIRSGASGRTQPGSAGAQPSAEQHQREMQWQQFNHLLHLIAERRRLVENHLSSAEALRSYIAQHNSPALIQRRIDIEVAAKRSALKAAMRTDDAQLSAMSSQEVYVELLKLNIAAPMAVFPEAPGAVDLCQLNESIKKISSFQSAGRLTPEEAAAAEKLLRDAFRSELEYVQKRWKALSGRDLEVSDFPPPLSELSYRKTTLPSVSSWSYRRYGEEARVMRQRAYRSGWPSSEGGRGADGSHERARDNRLSREAVSPGQSGVRIESTRGTDAESGQPTGAHDTSRVADRPSSASVGCDAREIVAASGGRELQSPSGSDPRYTFPQ